MQNLENSYVQWHAQIYHGYIWAVANFLGIDTNDIIFTNNRHKAGYILNRDITIHYDDCQDELFEISQSDCCIGVNIKDL